MTGRRPVASTMRTAVLYTLVAAVSGYVAGWLYLRTVYGASPPHRERVIYCEPVDCHITNAPCGPQCSAGVCTTAILPPCEYTCAADFCMRGTLEPRP